MINTRTMTQKNPKTQAAKIALGIAVGAALAVGAGVGIYGVLHLSRPKPANVSMVDPATLARPAPVVGERIGQFRPDFDHARCIAVSPADELYITGDMAIRRFDAAGGPLSEIETTEPPEAVAVDANGNIYATFGDKIWVFDASGNRSAAWDARDGALFTSIAAANGEVFAADAAGRCVIRYDKTGKVLGVIGKRDTSRDIRGLLVPSPYFDVTTSPDGLVRVTNPGRHTVEGYTLDGDRKSAWGFFSAVKPGGFVGCCNPANFAVIPAAGDESGAFAGFVTAEKGVAKVKVFDAKGKFAGLLAPADTYKRHDELISAKPTGRPFRALDLAAGAAGQIYVLDGAIGEVHIYEWRKKNDGVPAPTESQQAPDAANTEVREEQQEAVSP